MPRLEAASTEIYPMVAAAGDAAGGQATVSA